TVFRESLNPFNSGVPMACWTPPSLRHRILFRWTLHNILKGGHTASLRATNPLTSQFLPLFFPVRFPLIKNQWNCL
ncbi:hypothetical protein ACT6OA_004425, partial [Yersinia enterocolitica]